MKNLLKSGVLLATIGLTVFTSCRRDGEEDGGGTTSKTQLDHLLIKEVFYTGSHYTRKLYDGQTTSVLYGKDLYIKIVNPTSQTIYLDNYALAQHYFKPNTRIDLDEKYNFIKTHFGVSTIVLFGGNGEQHPLRAGDSILIAKKAVNHSEHIKKDDLEGEDLSEYDVKQLLDLSGADFQWQKKEEKDSPNAKAMTLWYKDGTIEETDLEDEDEDFNIVNHTCVLALIKLGDKTKRDQIKKAFLEQRKSEKEEEGENQYFKRIAYTDTHHSHNESLMILPNKWVEDAVTICANSSFRWSVVDSSIDRGHKGVEDNTSIEGAKAISRKFDGIKLVDDNNSTSDFEVVKASTTTSKE